jgi:hypothetical protein
VTLLREIQSAATESKVDISTVLRKSRILAARLQNPELEAWVSRELNGYTERSVLPPYRVVPVEVRGHLRNGSGLHWNPAPIMTASLPENLRAWGEACYPFQPIAEIASLAAGAREVTGASCSSNLRCPASGAMAPGTRDPAWRGRVQRVRVSRRLAGCQPPSTCWSRGYRQEPDSWISL